MPLLFFAITVVITLIAISIGVWMWHGFKKEQVKDLYYTSSVIKQYYELSFNQWRNTLLNLGERLVAIDGEDKDSIRLEVVNSAIKNYEELLAFGFASPDGQVLTFSNSNPGDSLPNLMKSNNSRRSFIKAREAEVLSIGESYYFDNVLDWIIPLRVPIRDENGELVAVNTTALQYQVLTRELRGFGFDPNYRIHFVNEDFNVSQYYYPSIKGEYNSIIGQDAAIYKDTSALSIDNYSYFQGYNDYEKKESILVVAKLDGLNQSLVVSVSQEFLIDRIQRIVYIILVIYAFIIALLWLFFRLYQKKQEQYLKVLIESEANLKSIFESTSSIIALFDANKRLMEFNRSFGELAEGIVLTKGMKIIEAMKNKEVASIIDTFHNRALAGEKFNETIEYPTAKGTIFYSLSFNPIYQKEKITGLSMFGQDITQLKSYQKRLEGQTENLESMVKSRTAELEIKNDALESTLEDLKAAQQKLIQSEKMASLGILSAGIGHEINNPLNFIKNGATGLKVTLEEQNQNIDMTDLIPFFKIIDDGVTRANSIVKSLSHFSRSVKSMDEDCDLVEIVDHCLTILNNKLSGRVEIKKNIQQGYPKIKGNEGKLHQAILNVLSNAEQSIEEKGEIIIKLGHSADFLTLEIIDNGSGIEKENLSRIADPFFTTKDPGVGTGLGLFITFSIIEEHNGQVAVESNLNEGTSVNIEFKIED